MLFFVFFPSCYCLLLSCYHSFFLSFLVLFFSSFISFTYVNLCFYRSIVIRPTISYVIFCFHHSITLYFCLSLYYSLSLPSIIFSCVISLFLFYRSFLSIFRHVILCFPSIIFLSVFLMLFFFHPHLHFYLFVIYSLSFSLSVFPYVILCLLLPSSSIMLFFAYIILSVSPYLYLYYSLFLFLYCNLFPAKKHSLPFEDRFLAHFMFTLHARSVLGDLGNELVQKTKSRGDALDWSRRSLPGPRVCLHSHLDLSSPDRSRK